MAMWIRFKTTISGSDGGRPWAYEIGQIVRLGEKFGQDEIPAKLGKVYNDGVRAEEFCLPGDETAGLRGGPETTGVRGGPRLGR